MLQREILLLGKGFDAHTATLFVQVANRFASQIFIKHGNKMINGKSIMGVLSLGKIDGDSFFLLIKGDDELDAMNTLIDQMGGNFQMTSKQ